MSEIGQTFSRYQDALNWSLEQFNKERQRSLEAMKQFHPDVLKRFIKPHDWIRTRSTQRWAQALQNLKSQFGDNDRELTFAAIDGTCGKEQLSEMLVFYGASYAQGGTLSISEDVGQLKFNKWSPAEDTSVVAYLPVPLSGINQFEDEEWLFKADDAERATANNIHTGLMQLAEIFLAYRRVTSQDRPPNIVLLDHSLSSILMSSDVMYLVKPYDAEGKTLGWIGAFIDRWGRAFEPADGLVAHAHPVNHALNVPTIRMNALAEAIVARLTGFWQIGDSGDREPGAELTIAQLMQEGGFRCSETDLKSRVDKAAQRYKAFKRDGERIIPVNALSPESLIASSNTSKTLRQRWYDLRTLFEHIGEQLFRERKAEALQIHYPQNGPRYKPKLWI